MSDVSGEEGSPVWKWGENFPSLKNLWLKILETLTPNSQALCAMIMRHIWMHRNTFLYKGKFLQPKQLLSNALHQFTFYLEAQGLHHSEHPTCNLNPDKTVW